MIAKMKAPSEREKVSMREEIEREMALTRLEDPSVVVDEVVGRSSKTSQRGFRRREKGVAAKLR